MELSQSNSDNSSGSEKIIHENNLQLTELKFYIKKNHKASRYSGSSICKDKILSVKIIIHCEIIFTSQLYTNYNNFQQDSDLQMKIEKYIIPTKQYSSEAGNSGRVVGLTDYF